MRCDQLSLGGRGKSLNMVQHLVKPGRVSTVAVSELPGTANTATKQHVEIVISS